MKKIIILLFLFIPFIVTAQSYNVRGVLSGNDVKFYRGNTFLGTNTGNIYYVSNTGSDSNDGLSTSSPWQTINKVNNASFRGGDIIKFKSGDQWREQLTIPTTGVDGRPITFTSYGAGNKPIINGANLVSSWSKHEDNVWKAIVTDDPMLVYFDGTRGLEVVNWTCDDEFDWHWSNDTLYVNAPSDVSPATTYTSPGVEAGERNYGIYGSVKNYINISNIEIKYTMIAGIKGVDSNDWIVDNVKSYQNGPTLADVGSNCMFDTQKNCVIRNCTFYEGGRHNITIYECFDIIIENNKMWDGYHSNVDIQSYHTTSCGDITVRNNEIFYSASSDINSMAIFIGGDEAVDGVDILENTIYDLTASSENHQGIQTDSYATNVTIYNNSLYNLENYCLYLTGTGTMSVINNRFFSVGGDDHRVMYIQSLTGKTVNYNDYSITSGVFAYVVSTTYTDWATYQAGTGFDALSRFSDSL